MSHSNKIIPIITLIAATSVVSIAAADETTIADTGLSVILFIFSSVRTLFSQGTFIAFSPVRLTYKITTWFIRKIILNITQLASYPVVSFILAAIGCGLLIGFCAGFAVEAFSSMLLSATWGKPKPTLTTEEQEEHEPIEHQDVNDGQGSPLLMASELKSSYKDREEPLTFEQYSDDDYSVYDKEQEDEELDENTELMHEILKRHLAAVSQEQQQQQQEGNLRRRTPVVA
ncbi:hypothetical protein BDA99DRAFT_518514 [Phascolomyces articulosus]|uniref:Uncharacterized protein n=1 Tax=Phascolomyces articulosus TaxID=60185 RepID=A0AAD5K4A0_9FUNG|nr:hypothetical protein BDA99DRAFT_518514 [Phascolomyces articulosus]